MLGSVFNHHQKLGATSSESLRLLQTVLRTFKIGKEAHGFSEFLGVGPPRADYGLPGDIYVDLTPGALTLYARYSDDWRAWPGPQQMTHALLHPEYPNRRLWCTGLTYGWFSPNFIKLHPGKTQSEILSEARAPKEHPFKPNENSKKRKYSGPTLQTSKRTPAPELTQPYTTASLIPHEFLFSNVNSLLRPSQCESSLPAGQASGARSHTVADYRYEQLPTLNRQPDPHTSTSTVVHQSDSRPEVVNPQWRIEFSILNADLTSNAPCPTQEPQQPHGTPYDNIDNSEISLVRPPSPLQIIETELIANQTAIETYQTPEDPAQIPCNKTDTSPNSAPLTQTQVTNTRIPSPQTTVYTVSGPSPLQEPVGKPRTLPQSLEDSLPQPPSPTTNASPAPISLHLPTLNQRDSLPRHAESNYDISIYTESLLGELQQLREVVAADAKIIKAAEEEIERLKEENVALRACLLERTSSSNRGSSSPRADGSAVINDSPLDLGSAPSTPSPLHANTLHQPSLSLISNLTCKTPSKSMPLHKKKSRNISRSVTPTMSGSKLPNSANIDTTTTLNLASPVMSHFAEDLGDWEHGTPEEINNSTDDGLREVYADGHPKAVDLYPEEMLTDDLPVTMIRPDVPNSFTVIATSVSPPEDNFNPSSLKVPTPQDFEDTEMDEDLNRPPVNLDQNDFESDDCESVAINRSRKSNLVSPSPRMKDIHVSLMFATQSGRIFCKLCLALNEHQAITFQVRENYPHRHLAMQEHCDKEHPEEYEKLRSMSDEELHELHDLVCV
ncbi:hypothetical protein BDZ97DRAFT_1837808 [Flammula alnicola]|nr:hypothetical protein BDZ97DRAFT_1837808 [Flammula alnicola]